MSNILEDAVSLLKKIKEADIATIQFIKKDGSLRLMKCTLNFKKIPEESYPKNMKLEDILSLIKKNILRVYDIEKNGWRSIPVDRTEFVIVNNVRYSVKLDLKKENIKK